jgi:membrane protein implicated in regulation of membrane protease activity
MFVELVVPSGFYLFLLGVSGVVVGGVVLVGIVPDFTAQLVLFSVVAVVTCFCLAGKLRRRLQGGKPMTAEAVGRVVKISEVITPGAVGSGELWGSVWRVRNTGPETLDKDAEAIVIGVEGLTLQVKRQ